MYVFNILKCPNEYKNTLNNAYYALLSILIFSYLITRRADLTKFWKTVPRFGQTPQQTGAAPRFDWQNIQNHPLYPSDDF